METAAKLNYLPTKGGFSNYFSPREILHHMKLNYYKHCSVSLLSYVLSHNKPTLTNTACAHALDCLFYMLSTTNRVGTNVTISPHTRSSPNLTSLSFALPLPSLQLLTLLVNLTVFRTSRSLISEDTFYLTPLWTLLCLQEWMIMMKMTTNTLPLQECLYQRLKPQQGQMTNQKQNLITTLLTLTRLTTLQAKHSHTAPEAIYLFTVSLVNHCTLPEMRHPMKWNCPS